MDAQRRIPNSPANRRTSSRKPEIIDGLKSISNSIFCDSCLVDSNLGQLPLDAIDYKVRMKRIDFVHSVFFQFGTFPFRQSQISTGHGHSTRPDWLNRIPSSFRSVNIDRVREDFLQEIPP